MTMNTEVHIVSPVNPEALFLHILAILEANPSFRPNHEKPEDEQDPWGPTTYGPLTLGKASYYHVRKGEPRRRLDGELITNHTTGEVLYENVSKYSSVLGQGLACIWDVTYGDDGPLQWPDPRWYETPEEIAEYLQDRNDYGDTVESPRLYSVECSMDTAYSYRVGDANCGDLHAYLLWEIGRYLGSVDCTDWVWEHEEKGSWHGPSEIDLRGDILRGGQAVRGVEVGITRA